MPTWSERRREIARSSWRNHPLLQEAARSLVELRVLGEAAAEDVADRRFRLMRELCPGSPLDKPSNWGSYRRRGLKLKHGVEHIGRGHPRPKGEEE